MPTIKTYIQYLSDKAYGKGKSEKETELRQQKLEAEIALKESQGEMHRMRAEIAAGKYVDVEEVALDYQKFFVTFKALRVKYSFPACKHDQRQPGAVGGPPRRKGDERRSKAYASGFCCFRLRTGGTGGEKGKEEPCRSLNSYA